MLFLGLAVFLFIFSIMCFARYFILKAREKRSDYDGCGAILLFFSLVLVATGFLVSGVEWANQISDFEDIKKFQKVEAIYQAKAEMLTTEFAKHLAETYPEHEKDIYDKISPDKVNMYFARYPELRTSETLVALVEHINKLQSDVYNQQINVEQLLKNTRFRRRNPWYYSFMIPTE